MRLVALEILSPYLSMNMKNVKIRGRMCPMYQFEGKVVLDSEIDSK
jgi:collagenase-like PrtC family protease